MAGTGAISGAHQIQGAGAAQGAGQTGQPTDNLNPIKPSTSLSTPQQQPTSPANANLEQTANATTRPSSTYDPNEHNNLLKNALQTGTSPVGEKANDTTGSNPVYDAETHSPLFRNNLISKPNSEQTQAATKSELEGTTITKEISSGQHPHLDEEINNAVQDYFNPKQKKPANAQGFLEVLKEAKIAKDNGDIDFKELGLNKKTIDKAGIKGTFLVQEDGSFDFKINGKCSKEAKECLEILKSKLETIKAEKGFDVPININPEAVGPLSAADRTILERGGQIQYRPLLGNKTMKLILDPGSDGQNDGLTISVYGENSEDPLTTQTIPLNVVFEGAEFNGQQGVKAFLPNWRDRKLFENSIINTKKEVLFKSETNEDNIDRIQNQNMLWNAVNEYLKVSAERTDGHFDISNKPPEDKTKNTHNTNETENAVNNDGNLRSENNHSPADTGNTNAVNTDPQGATINENQQGESSIEVIPQEQGLDTADSQPTVVLATNPTNNEEIFELSNSLPLVVKGEALLEEKNTTAKAETAISLEVGPGNPVMQVEKEETPQEQGQNINSLRLNSAVDLKGETSSTQSNSINSQTENVEDPNAVGRNANHSVETENATITNENSQGVIKKEENIQQNAQLEGINNEQTVDNSNEAITEELNIVEHFNQLNKEFAKIKNGIPEEKYKEFETEYEKYQYAIQAYAKRPNKSKSFNELLDKLSKSMKIQKDEDLLSAVETFANLMKTVTKDLKIISDFEDLKDKKINFEELNKLTGIVKQAIGQTILTDLANKGITTANKIDTETVDELINFHKEHQEHTTYNTLLTAFIEHKKSEAK